MARSEKTIRLPKLQTPFDPVDLPGEEHRFRTILNELRRLGKVALEDVDTQTYAATNVTEDRTFNANSTTVDEIADVLGTLISDLRAKGLVD
jgi:hypothetical protein